MQKSILLARSNLRGAKGQAAAIVVLILISSLMLNFWLMLSMDYRQNFDRYHDKLNAEHVTLAVDGEIAKIQDFLEKILEKDSRTKEFSLEDSMHMVGSFGYNDGEINLEFVILEKQTAVSKAVGKVEIVEEGNEKSGIYMPMLYKSKEIDIGKTVELTIGSRKVKYTVCGFFNSIMAGSHNCGMCEIVLTEDKYKELEKAGYAPKSTLCSIRLKDKSESENYEAMLKNTIFSTYPTVRAVSNSYALVTQSRYISQMICAGVLCAMACFVLLIALVVLASNIINYIQENMKNLGALKAVGYTSSQIVHALLLQFLGLTSIAALIGAGSSYLLFPFVNTMMISQTGIPYAIHFLPVPFGMTLLILDGVVALVVWASSRKMKKIEPIVALRQGISTHNFKPNPILLEKTKAPLNLALALKTTFSGKKNNITICITMFVLSLVVVFSGLMVENVIADMTPFLNLIVGETADSCININAGMEEAFLQEMEDDEQVEKIYLYHSLEVRHIEGVGLMATICDDFSKVNNQTIVFEGRFPKYDNEIAIAAKYAKEKGLLIGNEISITSGEKEAAYIISGFTQTSNNLGKDCLLTRAGYERLGSLQNMSYYLNLTEKIDPDVFHLKIKNRFGKEVNATVNIVSTVQGAGSVYVSLMTAIVIAIFVLGSIVAMFVLYLLVRTMLSNKKKEYGILKALGFTTRQLILQTAFSFMPPVIGATVIGIAVCSQIINPLTALFLSGIGIVKCTFTVPALFITAAGIWLILFAFGMVCLLSLKIKKIAPRELLVGE